MLCPQDVDTFEHELTELGEITIITDGLMGASVTVRDPSGNQQVLREIEATPGSYFFKAKFYLLALIGSMLKIPL